MAVTMAEVAARAGVSVMTVSYAFSRPERVSATTRDLVHRTAQEMGYTGPDPGARALRTRRAGAIGVVLGEHLTYAFEDPQATRFLAGVAAVCVEAGLGLTLIPVTGGPGDADRVREAAVDGYVVWTTADDDPVLEVIGRRPAVVAGGPAVPGAGLVTIDDRAAARAVGLAVFRGARSPAVLSFPMGRDRIPRLVSGPDPESALFPVTRLRLAGYRDAITELGGDWATVRVLVLARNDAAEARAAASAIEDADAVAAMSDQIALALPDWQDGRAAGRRATDAGNTSEPTGASHAVSRRISGWDDTAAAAVAGLTTVSQSLRDQGKACARQVVSGVVGVEQARWRLVERASTAGPADEVSADG
ncbi:LacI family DNA-binding transcriptional regulator [Actinoplanes sp. NPDC051494]|uniref:LacI family DNA-binding transcriptional regulator n=1 Tax=Actinoplanes sp. NPDC051494 TaxID=3363907 RepID=UPI003789EB71